MIQFPAEIFLQIAKYCETRRDVAALVATCRHTHGYLEAYLYRCEYQAASLDERDDKVAIAQASRDPTRIRSLRKWLNCIPNGRETGKSRRDWYLGAALRTAASAGNEYAVLLLLNHGAPKDFQNTEHQTALMCSLISGHVDIAKLLIRAGCDMSLSTTFTSPMAAACRLGDNATEIVQTMLDRGINPCDPVSGIHFSGPGEAVAAGSLSLLRLFTARGVDFCSQVDDTWRLPVYVATVWRQYEALEFLLQSGFYPPWHTRNGQKLQASICRYATVESMHLFFKHTDLATNDSRKPLDRLLILVVRHNRNQDLVLLVRFLISHGADVNSFDRHDEPVLGHAISRHYGNKVELLDVLIKSGADVNRFFNPIDHAIRDSSVCCLVRLIEAGADLSRRGPGGKTPLILASTLAAGDDFVRIILEHHKDNIDAKDDHGETALQCAIRSRCAASVWQLLGHGANPNQFTAEGLSMLSLAVRHNKLDSMSFLINAGADVDALDETSTGLSPLMHAVNNEDSDFADLLFWYGANREVRDKTGRGLNAPFPEYNPME